MRLEDIGFYTLSDYRASQASMSSPLWRCEILITPRCNYHCPYCRGLKYKEMDREFVMQTLAMWCDDGLKNVRFSGGEPTLHPYLPEFISYCKGRGVERIAVSTNGSNNIEYYRNLVDCGVNDFSISLDAGCCAIGDKMSGGIKGSWAKVVANIRELSKVTYVSVGMVFTEENINTCYNDVVFAYELGVSDIRVIPSAQYNKALTRLVGLPDAILQTNPVLNYRIKNIRSGRSVRGISEPCKCFLVLDDMAVAGDYHFPCIIYLREGGRPIGRVSRNMRQERYDWMLSHKPHLDPICKEMCLDVCADYNKKVNENNVRIGTEVLVRE